MTIAEIIQQVISQTMDVARNMDKLTEDEAKYELTKIGGQAIARIKREIEND